jgi:hypothetical protein
LVPEGSCPTVSLTSGLTPRARPECEKDCWRNSQVVKSVLVKSAYHAMDLSLAGNSEIDRDGLNTRFGRFHSHI